MYFDSFTNLNYDFTIRSDSSPKQDVVVDVMRQIKLSITDEDRKKLSDEIMIVDGQTPESLSYDIYGTPEYHWTILYLNKIYDLSKEWPLTEAQLNTYVIKKYGAGHEFDIHHYEKLPEGIVMDPSYISSMYGETAYVVTNYDHESALNDIKRVILVVKPSLISAFVDTFSQAMK